MHLLRQQGMEGVIDKGFHGLAGLGPGERNGDSSCEDQFRFGDPLNMIHIYNIGPMGLKEVLVISQIFHQFNQCLSAGDGVAVRHIQQDILTDDLAIHQTTMGNPGNTALFVPDPEAMLRAGCHGRNHLVHGGKEFLMVNRLENIIAGPDAVALHGKFPGG